ncbi:xylose isomerase-like protein [Meira miltonrushii]|uniref:Xylose isomerase-like protein n=1 Tax=Meira miltonrushii TaxID=1280837 RepID=A0A316VHH7_9BASI|nr:xylose isomerase-like protein [Meira miltonrushii]PWN36980.1 xylose isomerase-like protein [Meira miltonrushii]
MFTLPQAVPFGICTRSLGRSGGGHYILDILDQCAKNGLWTIEVAHECLEGYAKTLEGYNDPKEAIREVARLCNERAHSLGLVLTVLDAFENYEGLIDRSKHVEQFEDFQFWIELCGIMGIEYIQIPASFQPTDLLSKDEDLIIEDLRKVADAGLSVIPPVKIAYEPLGWSTYIKTWEQGLEIVKKVNRSNFGLCLDTFHIASLLSHSPETKDGLREGGDIVLKESLERLRKIDPNDIFIYQVSDGAHLLPPIPQSVYSEDGIDPLFAWSKHGRPFPGEGYFPVKEISQAIFATGFRGPTILETFEDDGFDTRKNLLAERANRAVGSWIQLGKSLGLAPFHPPTPKGQNKLGTCTVNIGDYELFSLEDKLYACASVGHQAIDLYEDDFLHYLSLTQGANKQNLWEPNPIHLAAAKKIGDLCASLGMQIICFQPLIDVEGLTKEEDRKAAAEKVKAYFPYMRALRTNITYITTNRSYNFEDNTGDIRSISADLALFADLAADYSRADKGPLLKIGYEPLSWGSHINTFDKAWEAVQLADRENLGIVLDTFNLLAVEYADPYNPQGHGRLYDTLQQSSDAIHTRLSQLVQMIPGDKIFVVQVADACLVNPKALKPPTPADKKWTSEHEPKYRQWSTSYRLFPNEQSLGGYLPVAECLAAILATGYEGPLTLEIFNDSIHVNEPDVVARHAKRSFIGIESCVVEAQSRKADYVTFKSL